jgi:hypothetical protein
MLVPRDMVVIEWHANLIVFALSSIGIDLHRGMSSRFWHGCASRKVATD